MHFSIPSQRLQVGLVDKKVGAKGQVQMRAIMERGAYAPGNHNIFSGTFFLCPNCMCVSLKGRTCNQVFLCSGETVVVIANVNNSSTKEVKLKYTLKKIVVYRAQCDKKSSSEVLMRAAGDVIKPNSQRRVIGSIQIPADMAQSISDCQILSVEYFLRV